MATAIFTCSVTGATVESKSGKLPRGWKFGASGEVLSDAAYDVREIALPVAEVVADMGDDRTNAERWKVFLAVMREAWSDSTACMNWASNELSRADGVRLPAMNKFSEIPIPKVYLYGSIARKGDNLFPRLAASSANCLARLAEQKHRAARYDVIWLRKDNFPRYKYPQPYPTHNASWSVSMEEHNGHETPVIRLSIGGQKWRLRLKTGPGFRRQIGVIRGILDGTVKQGQLDLISKDRGQVQAKLIVTMARKERPTIELNKTLYVSTGQESFLVAVADWRGRPWIYNADHVRRWIAQHAKRLQRWSEDQKPECRMPEKAAEQMGKVRDAACKHQRNRLSTFCHTAAKQVVEFSARNRVETITFDGSDHSYLGELKFPWFEFAEKLKMKCLGAGMKFNDITKDRLEAKAKAETEANGTTKQAKTTKNKRGKRTKAVASGEVTPEVPAPLANGKHGENAHESK